MEFNLDDFSPVSKKTGKATGKFNINDFSPVSKSITPTTPIQAAQPTQYAKTLKEAIAMQESAGSGDYSADNGIALGKYQIVPKYHFDKIGLKDTPANRQKFLNTPDLQEQLFEKVVNEYKTKYKTDEKALAAYYGGNLGANNYGTKDGDLQGKYEWNEKKKKWDTSKPTGYPSVNEYVAQVTAKLEPKVNQRSIEESKEKIKKWDEETKSMKTPSMLEFLPGEFIKSVGSIAQAVPRFATTAMNTILGDYKYASKDSALGKAQRLVFGDDGDKGKIGGVYEESAGERELAKKIGLPEEVGTVAFLGLGISDYIAPGKSKLLKAIVKANTTEEALRLSKELGLVGKASENFVANVVNTKTEKEASKIVDALKIVEADIKKAASATKTPKSTLTESPIESITVKKPKTTIKMIEASHAERVPEELMPIYKRADEAKNVDEFVSANTNTVKALGLNDVEAKEVLTDIYKVKQSENVEKELLRRQAAEAPKPKSTVQKSIETKAGVPKPVNVVVKDSVALKRKFKELESTSKVAKATGKKEAKDTIKEMQDDVAMFMVKHLPKSLRGSHIVAIKNATTIGRYKQAIDRLTKAAAEYKKLKETAKRVATKASKVSYINKVASFSPKVMSEIKKAIGLVDKNGKVRHIRYATEEQIDMALDMIKDRFEFVKKEGLLKGVSTGKKELNYTEYAAAYKQSKKFQVKKAIQDIIKGASNMVNSLIRPVSSAVDSIFTKVGNRLARVSSEEAQLIAKGNKRIMPFIRKIHKLKPTQMGMLNAALLNGKFDDVAVMAKNGGFLKEWETVKKYLDDMYDAAIEAGIDIGKREDYFPRLVKDSIGLQDALESSGMRDRWIREEVARLGRVLTEKEEAELLGKRIRGFGVNKNTVYLPKSRFEKERVVDVVEPSMAKFYADPIDALVKYNELISRTIATNKFFGKRNVKYLEDGNMDWTTTIGNLVNESNLSNEKQRELMSLLVARFASGTPSRAVQITKDLIYSIQMNSFLSAITQVQDIVPSMYVNGVMPTLQALLSKKGIKIGDLGLEKISAEMASSGVTSKLVDKIFTFNRIKFSDTMMKETFLNAAALKFSKASRIYLKNGKAGKESETIKNLKFILGDKSDAAIEKFARGNVDELLDDADTFHVLFNQLERTQPISLNQMPKFYLEHPNARVLYTLKTWSTKTIDFIRKESLDKIVHGDANEKVKGFTNLLGLLTIYTASGVGTDYLKDWIVGKESEPIPDMAFNNLLKIFMMNKYALDSIVGGGKSPVGTLLEAYIPGASTVNDVVSDIRNSSAGKQMDLEDYKTSKAIPVVGRVIYQRGKNDSGSGKKKVIKKKTIKKNQ